MPFDRVFADKLVRPNCTYFMKLNPLARSITGAARDEPHPLWTTAFIKTRTWPKPGCFGERSSLRGRSTHQATSSYRSHLGIPTEHDSERWTYLRGPSNYDLPTASGTFCKVIDQRSWCHPRKMCCVQGDSNYNLTPKSEFWMRSAATVAAMSQDYRCCGPESKGQQGPVSSHRSHRDSDQRRSQWRWRAYHVSI